MTLTVQFTVTGGDPIHCAGCEQRITTMLRRLPGVEQVDASHETQQVVVTFDPGQVKPDAIRAKLAQGGFQTASQGEHP
jgi:copper chaperone CopZ